MSEPLVFDGELTAGELTEAAIRTTVSLQPFWSKALSTASGGLHAVLAVVATLGILQFAIVHPGKGALPLPVVGLVVLASFLWVWGVPQVIFRSIYGTVASAPFQDGLRISFGPDGVGHFNGRSSWTTDWRDVTEVLRTKRTVMVVASGVALPVALRHVADPDALMARIAEWREAAA